MGFFGFDVQVLSCVMREEGSELLWARVNEGYSFCREGGKGGKVMNGQGGCGHYINNVKNDKNVHRLANASKNKNKRRTERTKNSCAILGIYKAR